jgi:hypothetical protein
MNQSDLVEPASVEGLTCRQAQVLEAIVAYVEVTEEACRSRYLSQRLAVNHTTVLDHFRVLYRKGWLRGASSPALPTLRALSHRHR